MANSVQVEKFAGFTTYLPAVTTENADQYKAIFEENRHRIYSFAFWMTDNELAAEEISGNVFLRAFAMTATPTSEFIDRALLTELRDYMTIGPLTLSCKASENVENIRKNTKRVHLERAIVQLPATERMIFCMHDGEGYAHERIARTLGLTTDETRVALHQARLRIRELVAKMN